MMQFVNNIWNALSSENEELLNLLMIPGGIIEIYLFMNLFLNIFNVIVSKKEKILYVSLLFAITTFTLNIIPSPYNVLINYISSACLIYFIFKLGPLKSFISSIIPSFIFGVLNTLVQNPYLTLFNIDPSVFISTPVYRIPYLIILYMLMYHINFVFKNFKQIKLNLDVIDYLDKKTLILLTVNLCIGFLTLCIQLVTTTFYINIVPITISILNFILLVSFLVLSIYSFTRMVNLEITKKDLACAEDYNKSLEILYDKVKGFKHDFNNIVSTLDGYIENYDKANGTFDIYWDNNFPVNDFLNLKLKETVSEILCPNLDSETKYETNIMLVSYSISETINEYISSNTSRFMWFFAIITFGGLLIWGLGVIFS